MRLIFAAFEEKILAVSMVMLAGSGCSKRAFQTFGMA